MGMGPDLRGACMTEPVNLDADTIQLLKDARGLMPETVVERTFDEVIWLIAKEYLSTRGHKDPCDGVRCRDCHIGGCPHQ